MRMLMLLLASVWGISAIAGPVGQISGRVTILEREGAVQEDHSNVVVFLEGVPAAESASSTSHLPRVSHLGRMFSPRVLPIVRGTQVDFFNDDDIYHNVFSVSRAKPFDLGIYPEGSSKLVTFSQPGLVKLYCNIHPKMVANVLVLNNSFYAVTNSSGQYLIENVPEGEFTLRFWHELSDEVTSKVSVSSDAPTEMDAELVAINRVKQHKNKFGKTYRSKY